jgi:integrase
MLVRRIFRWGVAEELVPPAVIQGLSAITGLQRTAAREPEPVRPADPAAVAKAIPFLPPPLAALVRLQTLTGARGGELLGLKAADIDRSGDVWTYSPAHHKGSWQGKSRTIYFGREAQSVLAPIILRAGDGFLFSPARAELDRRADGSAARTTKLWPSHAERNRKKRKRKPKRTPGETYTRDSYRIAIRRACERAGVEPFRPHRLRHLTAMTIREKFGVEHARAALGHSLASMTQIYSRDADGKLAREVAAKVG